MTPEQIERLIFELEKCSVVAMTDERSAYLLALIERDSKTRVMDGYCIAYWGFCEQWPIDRDFSEYKLGEDYTHARHYSYWEADQISG